MRARGGRAGSVCAALSGALGFPVPAPRLSRFPLGHAYTELSGASTYGLPELTGRVPSAGLGGLRLSPPRLWKVPSRSPVNAHQDCMSSVVFC